MPGAETLWSWVVQKSNDDLSVTHDLSGSSGLGAFCLEWMTVFLLAMGRAGCDNRGALVRGESVRVQTILVIDDERI